MIGGEFDINPNQKQGVSVFPSDVYCYASGRTALYHILMSLGCKRRKLRLPDWLCYTMVEAVERADYEYVFYGLDEQFKVTVEALDRCGFKDGDVVLIVNYFGLQVMTETAKTIKEAYPNAIVIEDDVQAYWEFADRENPYADYRFTSLRKAFPIPDGGLVYTKRLMPIVNGVNTFAPLKIRAGKMKYYRGMDGIKDEDYLALFKQADALIPENYDSVFSKESKCLFSGTDFQQAKHQRQTNAKYLIEGLASKGIEPLLDVPEDSVPLFVPIYLENRDEVRRKMFQYEVFCPVHWPLEGMPVKKGKEMAEHELSLIVDQRYTVRDMDRIIEIV